SDHNAIAAMQHKMPPSQPAILGGSLSPDPRRFSAAANCQKPARLHATQLLLRFSHLRTSLAPSIWSRPFRHPLPNSQARLVTAGLFCVVKLLRPGSSAPSLLPPVCIQKSVFLAYG